MLLLGNKVGMVTKRQTKKKKIKKPAVNSPAAEVNNPLTPASCPLEEFIQKRIDGTASKQDWKRYRAALPDDEAREQAGILCQTKYMAYRSELLQESKAKKKAEKEKINANLAEKMLQEDFAALYNRVVQCFATALQHDVASWKEHQRLDSNALAGKWAPSVDDAIDRETSLGRNIALALYAAEHQPSEEDQMAEDFHSRVFMNYRKNFLTPLRAAIKIPETLMSKRMWSEIEYERVPSVCMEKYKKAFLEHDPVGFTDFLSKVKEGKKKIPAGALLPIEILIDPFLQQDSSEKWSPELEKVAECQWNNYVENLKKSGTLKSAMAVLDVASGSMDCEPMLVAAALSLLVASVSHPPFDSSICSFSATPQVHKVDQRTLKEKAAFIRGIDWGMTNSNTQGVFDLILKLATDSKLPPEEMVETIFIFSDMEFDARGGEELFESDHDVIKRKFEEAGYPLPGVVYWNVRGAYGGSKPAMKNAKNVALVSGYSGQMLKTFLESGEVLNPYQTMLNTLGTHYDHLHVCD